MKAAVILALLLTGCAAVDAAISIAGRAADSYLTGLDASRIVQQTKLDRTNTAYCLSTLPSLRRYAAKSVENRQRIAKNCGLIVESDTLIQQSVGTAGDM